MPARLCQEFPDKLNTGNISKESGNKLQTVLNQPLGMMPFKIKTFSKDQFQIPA